MRSIWLIVLVVLAALPSRAIADRAAQAKRHFARAKAFHGRGEYANALKELKAAYAAEPTPVLLYGIAQTYVKLDKCPDAIAFYQQYIDTKPSQAAADRAQAAIDACNAAPASAPAAPTISAKEHFARAMALHKQGDFAGALEQLTSAYDLEPTPTLMYAIAQTNVKLGQCPEAITFYQRFIDSKPRQEAVEQAQAAIESCKSTVTAKAETKVATTPPKAATKPTPKVAEIKQTKPADSRPARIKSAPPKPTPPKAAPPKAVIPRPSEVHLDMVHLDMEDRYDRHPVRKWAYAGAGLGAGAMLVATVFGAAGDSAQKSFDDAGCGDRGQVLRSDALASCVEYERRGARDVRIGNGLLLAGGSVLALSAILLVLDPGNIERPTIQRPRIGRVNVGLSPSSVQLSLPF